MVRRASLLLFALLVFPQTAHALVFGFVQAGTFPTGIGCYDVKSADLNGDGHPDIVSALNDAHGIAVLLGNGTDFAPSTFYSGGQALAVDLADYTGDGAIDILECDWSENMVRLWRNQGDGTFVPAGTCPAPGNPRDVVGGDFNGDGERDVAAALSNGQVHILAGTGNGGLAPSSVLSVGVALKGIAAADLDGDGDLDLVTIDSSGDKLIRLRNDGSLSFVADSQVPITGHPSDVALGDLDADGVPDAAMSCENNTVAVVKGSAAGFALPVVSAPIGNLAQSVRIADFDQEGGPDLLVSAYNDNSVTVLANADSLQFDVIAQATSGANPRSAEAVDVNGDGRMDVVTGDFLGGTVTYLRNANAIPHLVVAPSLLQFGDGIQGFPTVRSITFQNTGAALLTVTPGAIDGTQFGYGSGGSAVFNLQPGAIRNVPIVCLRTVLGPATGVAHFATTDPTDSVVAIDLLATTNPAYPKVTFDPQALDFGTNFVGVAQVKNIEFFNEGHATLVVTPGAIGGAPFSYANGPAPLSIPIGSSKLLAIRYSRAAEGHAADSVHVSTNDPLVPDIAIPLDGWAGQPPVAGFSAPSPITIAVGTQTHAKVVVRSLGTSPLHVSVPVDVVDLAEVSPFDLGPTEEQFYRGQAPGALWNLDLEGRIVTGGNNEYANGMDESNFLVQPGGVLGLGGREFRLGPVAIAPGLLATRKIFVPGDASWVRYVDVAENPNATPRTATFDLVDNIGYLPAGGLIRTSDGDATFELSDDWIVVPAFDRRSVGRVFRSTSSANVPVLASFFASPGVPGCFTRTKYVATVPPRSRLCVIQWAIQGADADDAQAIAQALRADPSSGLLYTDAIDRSTTWNLPPGERPFRPIAGEFTIAPGDSALLDIMYGAESASHDADLSSVLRITTDDPGHPVLEVPLAFTVGNGAIVGAGPDAPAPAALALSGFVPNPLRMSGTARVSFRLASSEPASLTLYDVRGRVLARHVIEAPQPGPQSLTLTRAQLAPGVVWMRLEQGGHVATGKGIVLP